MPKKRMSALSMRAVIAVGVALSVTPIFSSAQSSDANRMFNDVQAMRQEIAELRDMVERQGFELRKLKQARQEQGNRPSGINNAPSSQTYGSAGGYAPPGVPVNQESQAPLGNPTQPSYSNNQQEVAVAPVASSQTQPQQNDESFYRPYPDQAEGADGNQDQGLSQGSVPVSSAVITAPPLDRSSQSADTGYPPVVDRSIGGPAISTQYPRTTYSESDEYSVRQIQQAVPIENIPAANQSAVSGAVNAAANTGVIAVPQTAVSSTAIPGAVATASSTAVVAGSRVQNQAEATFNQAPSQQVAIASQAPVAAPIGVLSEADFYQQGFNLLKQSKHSEAVDVFEQQITAYPQGEYADDAYYWIAESMYVNRNLDVSKKNFKSIIDSFPQSTRLPDAMLKTAYIEQEQGNQIEARILLQEIVQFHPRSNAAISAKNRLAELAN